VSCSACRTSGFSRSSEGSEASWSGLALFNAAQNPNASKALASGDVLRLP
jgi:hypothetical protein